MEKYQEQTDQLTKIQLPSAIERVQWTKSMAAPGGSVGLEVFTNYVGSGAEMNLEFADQEGKKFSSFKARIHKNKFRAQVNVPANAKGLLYATVKLSKHGLEMKSAPLIILPVIEIKNAKWDKKEARRGDILKLTADVSGAPDGMEAMIEIWEYDQDEAHDLITKFPVIVKDKKIEAEWEYEYHEDTDEIPTEEEMQKYGNHYNPPEYFFRVRIGEVHTYSELLEFKDWVEIILKDELDNPIPNINYIMTYADGKQKKGKLDKDGCAIEKNIPPGKVYYEFLF